MNQSSTINFFKYILVLFVCLFLAQKVFADIHEKEKINTLLDFSMEELFNTEITGATFSEENLYSVPSSVTVFSGQEIRQMGLTTIESLMNYVPGFQSFRVDESGMTYSFSSRGRRAASNSREVLVLVNGQRMSVIATGGSTMLTPFVSLENVKRIEFIRGPGSALYGSNAFLGVVNIITDTTLNNIEIAAGSFDGFRIARNHTYEKNGIKASTFIKYFQDKGDKFSSIFDTLNQTYADTRDPRRGLDLYIAAEYKNFKLDISHTQRQNKQFYNYGGFSNDFTQTQRKYSYLNLSYQWNWLQNIDSTLRIGYRYSHIQLYIPLLSFGSLTPISQPSSADPLNMIAVYKEQEPIVTLHNSLKVDDKHTLEFGFEYRRPEITDILSANNFDLRDISSKNYPVRYYGDLRYTTPIGKERARSVLGLYGQYKFNPWEPLTITTGVRYDQYADFGSNTSPRFAFVYQPQEKTVLKLLYGEAFRAPSFVETDTVNNPLVIGNPTLHSENSKTWELVWIQKLKNTHFLMTYFDTSITDSIGVQLTNERFRTFSNGGEESIRGIELEVNAELTHNLTLRSTFTHFVDLPERSLRESSNMASLILNYHKGKWNFNISANWQDDKQFQYKTGEGVELKDLSSFSIFNSKLAYQLTSDTTLFTSVSNVLDKEYFTPPQETNNLLGVPNRGRQIEIGVNWAF